MCTVKDTVVSITKYQPQNFSISCNLQAKYFDHKSICNFGFTAKEDMNFIQRTYWLSLFKVVIQTLQDYIYTEYKGEVRI